MSNIEKGVTAESIVHSLASLGESAVKRLEKAVGDCTETQVDIDRGYRRTDEIEQGERAELEAAREALAAPIRQAAEWVILSAATESSIANQRRALNEQFKRLMKQVQENQMETIRLQMSCPHPASFPFTAARVTTIHCRDCGKCIS